MLLVLDVIPWTPSEEGSGKGASLWLNFNPNISGSPIRFLHCQQFKSKLEVIQVSFTLKSKSHTKILDVGHERAGGWPQSRSNIVAYCLLIDLIIKVPTVIVLTMLHFNKYSRHVNAFVFLDFGSTIPFKWATLTFNLYSSYWCFDHLNTFIIVYSRSDWAYNPSKLWHVTESQTFVRLLKAALALVICEVKINFFVFHVTYSFFLRCCLTLFLAFQRALRFSTRWNWIIVLTYKIISIWRTVIITKNVDTNYYTI